VKHRGGLGCKIHQACGLGMPGGAVWAIKVARSAA
jgi:hypothetical protein